MPGRNGEDRETLFCCFMRSPGVQRHDRSSIRRFRITKNGVMKPLLMPLPAIRNRRDFGLSDRLSEEALEAIEPLDESVSGHRTEGYSQVSFAAPAKCRPRDRHDVRLLEQSLGEGRRIGASLDACEGEETAAGRRPRSRGIAAMRSATS